jgi:hypothetical protein
MSSENHEESGYGPQFGFANHLVEEEELQPFSGDGVNKVSVRRTTVAIPQGSGVGCNTTSPFSGSRHYVGIS